MNTEKLTKLPLSQQLQLTPSKFTLASDEGNIKRRTKEGFSLTLDHPGDLPHCFIKFLLERDCNAVEHTTLKRTCKYFYLILQFLESEFLPMPFFRNPFRILACSDSKIVPGAVTHLHNESVFFYIASAHAESSACWADVEIFNIHVHALLELSKKAEFKFEVPIGYICAEQ